jgi:hypothetical protein
MTRRATLLETLAGAVPKKPVWTADISYWITGNERAEYQTEEGYLRFCDDLGCMPYYWYDSFWAAEREFPAGAVTTSTGADGIERRTTWSAGKRRLERVDRYSSSSWSQATVKHAVETAADLETLIDLVGSSNLAPSKALEEYPSRCAAWEAHDGIPSVGLPRSPLSAFINEWAGVEHGLLLLFDEPELCATLFELLESQEAPILEACIERGVRLVHFPDNLTSEVYAGLFDGFMSDCYLRRLAVLHRGGVLAAVHLDGTVAGLLPKLATTGIDAVEAVTPAPVGDIDAAAMRTMIEGSTTVLWGGVPGAMFAPPWSRDDMERHIRRLFEVWRGMPFVLGVADQVPPNGDIDTVARISELVHSLATGRNFDFDPSRH